MLPALGRFKWCIDSKGYAYARMRIGGEVRRVWMARLVWRLVHREWPKMQIDHINRVRLDNRIENLRDVDASTNNRNKEPLHLVGRVVKKQSGLPTGVAFDPRCDRYYACIHRDGKRRHIGTFTSPEAASAAYQKEVRRLKASVR